MSSFTSAISFLLTTLGGFYIMTVLLRFLLQLARADFYNPISQAIVKITAPLLNPLRRIIPSLFGVDVASLMLALLLQAVLIYANLALYNITPNLSMLPLLLLASLIFHILNIYLYSFIIIAIASWITQGYRNPGLMLLAQLTEPLSKRIRNIIPPIGGLDFSVMVIILFISFLKMSIYNFLPY